MEVTRKNFNEALPLIEASIEKADFLAIDAEFTGLINGRDVSIFDSPDEYYTTLWNGTSDFLLIQYGLCAFYWDEEAKHYMNDAYNFYLFPRGQPGLERMFLCQSSSLDFLAAQGFDFNKLIRDGISYMTEPTESKLRGNLTERQKGYSNDKELIPVPDEHKQQIEEICKNVREFLDEKKAEEMEIDRCNAFIRRLLFQELGARFRNEAFIESKVLENKNRVLKVTRITSENDGNILDMQRKQKEWEEFEDLVGFTKVARMISQSEKLVIGHNMVLDILHTLNHFFQPLPADYLSFKEFAHCMFPRLLDTKYMSSLPPFKDKVYSSVLSHLFTTLSEPPFSLPIAASKAGRGYCCSEDKLHEAGYDAYVTGLCFLSMYGHLSRMRGDPHGRIAAPDSALLKPFINKLFLAKTAHQDSPYMNLAGADPTPSRDHVFHLKFPKEWQRSDISQLFSAFGPITVQFLDDSSALIALSRREQARDAMRALAGYSRTSLVPYNKYKKLVNKTASQQQESNWRKPADKDSPLVNTLDSTPKSKQANRTSGTCQSLQTPHKPSSEKKDELNNTRSTPRISPSPAHVRKRTSSGVIQIDESEPPRKKSELAKSKSECFKKRSEDSSNGRRKTPSVDTITKKEEKQKETEDGNKKQSGIQKVLERFDSESDAKAKSAAAFKESDSWD